MIMIITEIQGRGTATSETTTHATSKQWHCTNQLYQLSSEKRRFVVAMSNLLYSSKNQQLFKKTSAIKVATMKIMDNFHYKWKPLSAYHKIDTFHGEQRHKEGHW